MLHHRTWLEISESALYHNIRHIQQFIGSTQLGVVVKGHAYGHGLRHIGSLLSKRPEARFFFTATVEEALELRAVGVVQPIVVLVTPLDMLEEGICHALDFVVYDMHALERIHAEAKKHAVRVRIHIEVDTGMSRSGFKPECVLALTRERERYPFVDFFGIFTHLSDSNSLDLAFTHQQIAVFDTVVTALQQQGYVYALHHVFSSGSLFLPQKYPLVRVGTLLYGSWKSVLHQERFLAQMPNFSVKPVMTWKSRIVAFQSVGVGEYVGYNRTYCAPKHMKIALVPLGYYDGYPRALSNKAAMLIGNHRAPVVGVVSMNMVALDVTDIPGVQYDQEVVVCGPNSITPAFLAESAGTIANEIVTRLPEHLPRIIVA